MNLLYNKPRKKRKKYNRVAKIYSTKRKTLYNAEFSAQLSFGITSLTLVGACHPDLVNSVLLINLPSFFHEMFHGIFHEMFHATFHGIFHEMFHATFHVTFHVTFPGHFLDHVMCLLHALVPFPFAIVYVVRLTRLTLRLAQVAVDCA